MPRTNSFFLAASFVTFVLNELTWSICTMPAANYFALDLIDATLEVNNVKFVGILSIMSTYGDLN
jgi:hypothetical protein